MPPWMVLKTVAAANPLAPAIATPPCARARRLQPARAGEGTDRHDHATRQCDPASPAGPAGCRGVFRSDIRHPPPAQGRA